MELAAILIFTIVAGILLALIMASLALGRISNDLEKLISWLENIEEED